MRTFAMLLETRHREFPDAPETALVYAARATGTKALKDGEGVEHRGAADNPSQQLADLLVRVRDAQDRAAFAALFRHFAPRIKGFLMKTGTPEAVAEDCAQDVMATLWQKAHQFDPARASVATWVYTIARNRRIDLARRVRPDPEELPWGPEPEPDQDEALILQQETERLGAALALLPDKQRELIERAYYGDLSHTEIADQTGLPLGTIKSRIRLALDRLRQQMTESNQ